jgi:hypothetical protein
MITLRTKKERKGAMCILYMKMVGWLVGTCGRVLQYNADIGIGGIVEVMKDYKAGRSYGRCINLMSQ